MYVLGIGAANVDVHGMSRAAIVMRDSNPGHLRTSAGGVTRNIMENLARLGVDARMVSAQGDDLFGEYVRSESEKAGLDMSECLVLPGVNSSSYVSILDERADMLVAMSDMSVLEHITPDFVSTKRSLIRGAAAVICLGVFAVFVFVCFVNMITRASRLPHERLSHTRNQSTVVRRPAPEGEGGA